MSFIAIERQCNLIDEEKKTLLLLDEHLSRMYQTGVITDPYVFQSVKEQVARLGCSAGFRKTWLQNTLEDFKKIRQETMEVFNQEEEKLRRLLP